MGDLQVKPATRSGIIPLVGFYGKSGSGKTMSALLFARGIVGPSGRIALIDTENKRGSIFADLIPGGYSVIDLDAPFTPQRYVEAIELAEQSADCVVIDSMSHEHTGEGGVLDMQEAELERMAGNDWKKRESCKMAAWIKPKLAHKKMVYRLLRSPKAVICCLRGEEKTQVKKGPGGKTVVETDEFSSPIFDQRFIFEMLVNFETLAKDKDGQRQGGFVIARKITHPDVARIIPGADEQIGVKHGAALADWCAKPGQRPEQKPTTKAATEATRNWMLEELLKVFPEAALVQFAIDRSRIMPDQSLRDWDLTKVPTSKPALEKLKDEIAAHQ